MKKDDKTTTSKTFVDDLASIVLKMPPVPKEKRLATLTEKQKQELQNIIERTSVVNFMFLMVLQFQN